MPIKDLSDRGRVPRLGKIRLGIKVPGEKSEFPKAVDYFVCPEEVRAVYGEKPKKLKIAFHSDSLEEIFPQYYKRYGSGTGLVCKGDGEIAMTLVPDRKQMQETQCPGRECEHYKANKCTEVGNLIFMIRGVDRFGVYQLDTGSYNTILNINGGLEFVKQITNGRLKMVPLILEVIPQEVNPEGKKKTVHVLRIEADVRTIMDSLESKRPGDVLILEPAQDEIEEDIHPQSLVRSIKGTNDTAIKEPDNNDISQKQLQRIFAIVGDLGWTNEEAKAFIYERYNVRSTKELTQSQASDLIEYLNAEIASLGASEVNTSSEGDQQESFPGGVVGSR
jgi:hypothetical protein